MKNEVSAQFIATKFTLHIDHLEKLEEISVLEGLSPSVILGRAIDYFNNEDYQGHMIPLNIGGSSEFKEMLDSIEKSFIEAGYEID